MIFFIRKLIKLNGKKVANIITLATFFYKIMKIFLFI